MKYYDEPMSVADYKEIYEMVSHMSYDVEDFNSAEKITFEELEKMKWIFAIRDVLCDVPLRRAEYTVFRKKLVYDKYAFLDSHYQKCIEPRNSKYQ